MGKKYNSVVVLWILPQFWWMIPRGVRETHTKFRARTSFWAQNTAKATLKSTLFAYFFKLNLPVLCLTAMEWHPCDEK